MITLVNALAEIVRHPWRTLLVRWHWKSALYSSICRSVLFFTVNLNAGVNAAASAMAAEFVYRAATAGFYGALTQSLRKVEPRWHGAAAATFLLVGVSHSLEFTMHWLRGTPNLKASIAASICFTAVSTLFNLHAMRNGVFVTGSEGLSLAADFKRLPALLAAIFRSGPEGRNQPLSQA